ncbi:MAG: UvrB/UvrC motif-containing protein [Spirochaetales bacterium]|nr:UvrB/UvrC motif-containing protein [Spirochaetales bacterium]
MMQNEGMLFYYRYLLLFQIGDYERTCRDTGHNLRICHLVEKYCTDKEDRVSLLQYKPYIIRINALSRSMLLLGKNEKRRALDIIKNAIEEIESGPMISSIVYKFERDRSVEQLRGTLKQLDESGGEEADRLEAQLEEAVANEDYERAARLRDKILSLKNERH